jgi:hypothetical protein
MPAVEAKATSFEAQMDVLNKLLRVFSEELFALLNKMTATIFRPTWLGWFDGTVGGNHLPKRGGTAKCAPWKNCARVCVCVCVWVCDRFCVGVCVCPRVWDSV